MKWVYGIPTSLLITSKDSKLAFFKSLFAYGKKSGREQGLVVWSYVETDFLKKARRIFGGMKWVYGIPTLLLIVSKNRQLTSIK